MLSENQKQVALLELGIERAPLWRPHPSLRLVVTRRAIDGRELRVLFNTPEARAAFQNRVRHARPYAKKAAHTSKGTSGAVTEQSQKQSLAAFGAR